MTGIARAAVAASAVLLGASVAGAQESARTPNAPNAPNAIVDRTVARFSSPETGGDARPRFVLERALAFEARLEAMAQAPGIGEGYAERDLHTALDHDIAEQMLASLAERFITDSPADKRPAPDEVPRVEQLVGSALLERLGGRARVDEAARAEQMDAGEVDALLHRAALAAWYLDHVITPILHPSDEQLRDVFRTSAHPFRGQTFETAHEALSRWFVLERLRVAEGAFSQSARSRVKITVTR